MAERADRDFEQFGGAGLISACSLEGFNHIRLFQIFNMGDKIYAVFGEIKFSLDAGWIVV